MHEGRNGQRRHRQPGPQSRARQVAALGQPGQRHRQHDGDRHGQRHQQHGVDQQFADARPEDQRRDGLPAGLDRDPDDEAKRQQRQERDENGGKHDPGHGPPAVPPPGRHVGRQARTRKIGRGLHQIRRCAAAAPWRKRSTGRWRGRSGSFSSLANAISKTERSRGKRVPAGAQSVALSGRMPATAGRPPSSGRSPSCC